jgi:predicted dehydrogenase
MSLKEALGFGADKKVRYAIVGVGSISQEAMMPGVEHTGNSTMTALVTGDPVKASELSEKYGIAHTYSYEQFGEMLQSGEVDAIYLATPNWRHAEFAVPALEAGIHVLLEKPMEVSSVQCQKILEAQQRSGAKLMVAYRLHFEPGTISAIEQVRSGKLGEVHLFTSTFSQMVDPANHRAQNGVEAGPIFDMGPYPINGVRNLFDSEPTEAFATGLRHADSGLGDFDDTVSVILKFPQNRLAQFTISYYGNTLDSYNVVGTEGALTVNPAYMYGKPIAYVQKSGNKESEESFKNTDHFGGEMKYFSECILNGTDPQPDGREGWADVRVIEAIVRSLSSGKFETVEAGPEPSRINPAQEQTLRAQKTPEMVHASSPARGMEKNPKN